MKTSFLSSFAKDLRALQERTVLTRVARVIDEVEAADNLSAIPNLKKLRASGGYYRLRVGDYRIGLIVRGGTACFVRCLHRKEIYRYFP